MALFGCSIAAAALTELLIADPSAVHNCHIVNSYVILEYLLTAGMIISISKRSLIINVLATAGGVFVIGLMIRHALKGLFYEWLATSVLITGGFVLALMAMISLYRLSLTSETPLKSRPDFWVLNHVSVYFICITPLFGLMRVGDLATTKAIFVIHDYLYLFRYVTAIAIFVIYRRFNTLSRYATR